MNKKKCFCCREIVIANCCGIRQHFEMSIVEFLFMIAIWRRSEIKVLWNTIQNLIEWSDQSISQSNILYICKLFTSCRFFFQTEFRYKIDLKIINYSFFPSFIYSVSLKRTSFCAMGNFLYKIENINLFILTSMMRSMKIFLYITINSE